MGGFPGGSLTSDVPITKSGPRRRLLSSITSDDLNNGFFPVASVREIRIADALVKALRITYVGELGWELHTPAASAREVYRAVMAAGEAHGVAPCGYRAIESLRLEKGYRAWSSDLIPDHTPLQAGLGFAVKLDTNTPFLGREALVERRQSGLTRRLACFTSDPGVVRPMIEKAAAAYAKENNITPRDCSKVDG